MRCLIVDDEQPARIHLRTLLTKETEVEVSGEFDSGEHVVSVARELAVDVVFLDIEMPPRGGLDVARALLEQPCSPEVVFLTGHSQHALEAYEIGVTDYLLKPVGRGRLRQTLERLHQRLAAKALAQEPRPGLLKEQAVPLERVLLTHPVSQVQEVVPLEEVSWFTATGDQVWAQSKGESYRVGQSLSRLESRLAGAQFLRVHKAYLVNLRKVRHLVSLSRRAYVLRLECGQELPLSRHYLEAFRSQIPGL